MNAIMFCLYNISLHIIDIFRKRENKNWPRFRFHFHPSVFWFWLLLSTHWMDWTTLLTVGGDTEPRICCPYPSAKAPASSRCQSEITFYCLWQQQSGGQISRCFSSEGKSLKELYGAPPAWQEGFLLSVRSLRRSANAVDSEERWCQRQEEEVEKVEESDKEEQGKSKRR